MKALLIALTASVALSACAGTPPKLKQPFDEPRSPVNFTAPPPLQEPAQ